MSQNGFVANKKKKIGEALDIFSDSLYNTAGH